MKGEFNQSKYIQDYMKENTVTKKVLFSRKNPEDVEMLRWLEVNKVNFSGMVKRMIKEKMEEGSLKHLRDGPEHSEAGHPYRLAWSRIRV